MPLQGEGLAQPSEARSGSPPSSCGRGEEQVAARGHAGPTDGWAWPARLPLHREWACEPSASAAQCHPCCPALQALPVPVQPPVPSLKPGLDLLLEFCTRWPSCL